MYPLRPPPTLIVDAWGFRLADPDGNLIGKQSGVIVTGPDGKPALQDEPGTLRVQQAVNED